MADKAQIQVTEGPDASTIDLSYNPVSYQVSKTVEKTGEGAKQQFKNSKTEDFTIEIFYDTYEKQTDVRKETEKIVNLTKPTVGEKETKRPPVCLFVWGGLTQKCQVSKVNQKFTMFLDTGIPVRAEVTVTFTPYLTPKEDEQNKGKDACRKLWTVKSGDRLDLIAYRTLLEPDLWPKIAALNNIADPLGFPREADLGQILIIPDYKELL
jgi:nucleoid-associated protein YgaU